MLIDQPVFAPTFYAGVARPGSARAAPCPDGAGESARIDSGLVSWVFLAAYTCSGLAGLVYEVAWTRLLTLHLGHTTAAASTVVAAFLLGDAHDSAAYLNLGLLDLAGGRPDSAANYFAEALWLDPASATAKEGLTRAIRR